MRVRDFEKAIFAINGVTLDEIKMRNAHVRQAIGHHERKRIIWDEKGQAYSSDMDSEVFSSGEIYTRSPSYDLNFEGKDE